MISRLELERSARRGGFWGMFLCSCYLIVLRLTGGEVPAVQVRVPIVYRRSSISSIEYLDSDP